MFGSECSYEQLHVAKGFGGIAQLRNELEDRSTSRTNKCFESQGKLRARIITDSSSRFFCCGLLLFCVYVVGDLFHFFFRFYCSRLGLTNKSTSGKLSYQGIGFIKSVIHYNLLITQILESKA